MRWWWRGIFLLLLCVMPSALAQTAKPVIQDVNQPDSVTNIIGNPFFFQVAVDDPTGVTYQWKKGTTSISGAHDATYSKDPSVGTDAGTYSVVCLNSFGSTTSSNATLTIWYYPVVTNFSVASNAVVAGSNVHFQVRLDQTKPPGGPYEYQWYVDGLFVLDDGVSTFGSDKADLWLSNVTSADTGTYSVDISDLTASITTNRGNSILNVVTPPSIIDQPDPLDLLVGDFGTLSLILDGATTDNHTFPLSYQWRKGGTNIVGATNLTYDFGPAVIGDSGSYSCAIKNWAGSTTSAVATVTVRQYVNITTDPVGATLAYSTTPYTLSAVVEGSAPLHYQWRFNQIDIPGATNATFSLIPTSTNQTGLYDLVVTNDISSDDSLDATIIVRQEISPPVCSFNLPVNNARWTNTSIGVTVSSSDNVGTILVRCQNQTAGTNWVNCTSNASNWTATMPLVPGSNSIVAEAYDAAGNVSLTTAGNVRNVFYPVPVPFTLLISGSGVVNTDTNWPTPVQKTLASNFMTLEYNRAYTMTGSPASTFRFVSWSGGTNSISSNFTFTVLSNMVLTGTFGETNQPTLTITNPAAGRYTNFGSFAVSGTAADNAQLSTVMWQLNNNPWSKALGTTAWTATVVPLLGSNIFRAYAIDTSSNLSTTNTLTFTNVTVAILNVITNGQGTISNSLAGQTLFVSSNYTMTAVASTNGFNFFNWTSTTNGAYAVATNSATLNFTMKSNLTLAANFRDVQSPSVTITNTLPSGLLAGGAFTARGTASDNAGLLAINYQLNSNAWAVATGTSNWQATVTLVAGTNTLRVYATDTSTNRSTTNFISAVNTLLTPVTVTLSFSNNTATAAFGSVTGATYYLEAKGLPDTNLVWTTLPGSSPGNGATLVLTDTNAPATNRFYRVRATSP